MLDPCQLWESDSHEIIGLPFNPSRKLKTEMKTKTREGQSLWFTLATNIDLMLSFSRNVFAISDVGDLEAMAMSIPFSLSACNTPLA